MQAMKTRWATCLCCALVLGALVIVAGPWYPPAGAQGRSTVPQYVVDPSWPKPLPTTKDSTGLSRQWFTGAVGAHCIDSRDHVFILTRAWEANKNGVNPPPQGSASISSPPVVEIDPAGNVVNSWGDATLTPEGGTKVLPRGLHGCWIDQQDNIWIGGYQDGVVQKWSHDGKKMLMQIGQKGVCDAGPTSAKGPYPTCMSPGGNNSQTLLNCPANLTVDPAPDPVTGQPGSIYIADGYCNHRVVVFDANGKYLRQWGSAGTAPGQFEGGGGHPHCVIIGGDGLVYVCDRGQNRIQVFTKTGEVKRVIAIAPPEFDIKKSTSGANDFVFSLDKGQTYMFDTDLDYNKIWVIHRESGKTVGSFGQVGHQAGDFILPHSIRFDSKGSLYIAETGAGNRIQKFVPAKG